MIFIDNLDDCDCWQIIPSYYENLKREPNDQYFVDILGKYQVLTLRSGYNKSYCKTQVLANFSKYNLSETVGDRYLMNCQVSKIQELNYSIEQLAFHSSLVSMISACEIFLKDSFRYFVQYFFPKKIKI